MTTIEALLDYLALYGGEIISTKDLSPEWIEQARASGRLYVDSNSLGYVWEPKFENAFPTTEKEVEEFEKWYPLKIELPEKFKSQSFINSLIAKLNKTSE